MKSYIDNASPDFVFDGVRLSIHDNRMLAERAFYCLKEISRFANGLEKDLEAVENSVACELSNGFVEGTNSKLKMVKRTMYGRCSKVLLAAKVIYVKAKRYG